MTIRLIGVGVISDRDIKMVSQIKPGDNVFYNYGSRYRVVATQAVSEKSTKITTLHGNKLYDQIKRNDTKMVVKGIGYR